MNNSELYCTVHFTYSEESIPKTIKDFVESQFMKARDEAIKLLNPRYEEWNAQYDKEVNVEDDMEYNAFIQSKHNEVLDRFNRVWMGPVKLYSDEYADICGKFKMFDKTVTMHMRIELLNENELRKFL